MIFSDQIPSFLAVSLAMANASPVTILTVTPIVSAVAMVALASDPRRIEDKKDADELPDVVVIGSGDPQGTKSARREFVDRLFHGRLNLLLDWPTN